ncbi:hypothetical protein Tco_0352229 [Tanacetum coccineum]
MRDIVRLKTERELVRIKIDDGNAFYWGKNWCLKVNAAQLKLNAAKLKLMLLGLLTAVKHKLMLPGITYYCWFWTSAKAKTINGERQIQALVDKKKMIISEKSVRRDLMLEDAEGIESPENMGEDLAAPTDSHSTPIITQPSSSKPQKKMSKRTQDGHVAKESIPDNHK